MASPLVASSAAGNSSMIGSGLAGRNYPDPFITYATMLMPQSIEDVLRWCEHLYNRNGTYAMATRRVVRYFLTKINIENCSLDEKKKYEKFLTETVDAMSELARLGDDFMCYGNSFSSLYVPFYRSLACPKCKCQQPASKIDYTFENFTFHWTCGMCKEKVEAEKPIDRPKHSTAGVYVKRWSPHEIRIRWHPISGKRIYLWEPPPEVVRQVQAGDHFIVNDMPWEMIEAIKEKKFFEFNDGVIYHMVEETLAGMKNRGWGVSRFMTNFCQAFHVQMLKMYHEVLCMEYIVPFRVITPKQTTAAVDPLQKTNISQHNSKLQAMIRQHRRHPGGYYSLPFAVDYQAIGGEGMQLNTDALIEQAVDEMLNAAGVPAELYKGTLQVQAMPTALRLFQQTWPHLMAAYDGWLNWLMKTLAQVFNWEKAKATMQPPTLADNVENKQILLQLAAANKVSMRSALASLGLDPTEELRQTFDEQREYTEESQKFQQDQQNKQTLLQNMQSSTMQSAGVAGQQQQQGQAGDEETGGQGQQNPVTPDDLMAQADQVAQQLLAMPYEQRRTEMLRIKKSNPTLHALVKSKMEGQRSQNRSVGGQQIQQQNQQQQQQQGQVNQA